MKAIGTLESLLLPASLIQLPSWFATFRLLDTPPVEADGPIELLMLSQMQATTSLLSGVAFFPVGPRRYRRASEASHSAPSVAPSSAPTRTTLETLQSPLSLKRRSRNRLAAAMSFAR